MSRRDLTRQTVPGQTTEHLPPQPVPQRGRYRILHLLPDLGPGGGQYLVLRHISNMDADRFEHVVCYLSAPHDLREAFEHAGFPPLHLDHHPDWRAVRTVTRLALLMRREGIDLVHPNIRRDRLPAELAALLNRTPVVTSLHSPGSARFFRRHSSGAPTRNRSRHALERWLHRRTVRHVMAVSELIRDQWLETCRSLDFPEDVSLVYPGVDPAEFQIEDEAAVRQALRGELGLRAGQPVLLNVAHLRPRKGHRWLLAMMPEVLRRFPDAVLLVAGEGRERAALEEEIAERGLAHRVRLLGNRHDVPRLLALADIFVFPSYELPGEGEAFGIAALEALAAGTPVVAFDLKPSDEFLEDGVTGRLVEPDSPQALADAVIEILDDRDRARLMGANARRVATERFDVRRWADELARVYLLVLEPATGTVVP